MCTAHAAAQQMQFNAAIVNRCTLEMGTVQHSPRHGYEVAQRWSIPTVSGGIFQPINTQAIKKKKGNAESLPTLPSALPPGAYTFKRLVHSMEIGKTDGILTTANRCAIIQRNDSLLYLFLTPACPPTERVEVENG